jgi:hypothetical protein
LRVYRIFVGVDKNQFSLFTFHRDEEQEHEQNFDILLDENERKCVFGLEPKLNSTPISGGTRGISAVSSSYESLFGDEITDNQYTTKYQPSDSVITGIFFQKTAREIATRIVAKTVLNSNCNVCIIGVHCIVSMCRLIRATRAQLPEEVSLTFNFIDISVARLEMLAKLTAQYFQQSMNFKIVCTPVNFLLVPNECLQNQHAIITFLHNSVDRLFALKYMLLQCYCCPGEVDKLQLILFTKRLQAYGHAAFSIHHCKDVTSVTSGLQIEVRIFRPRDETSESGEIFYYLCVVLFSWLYV